ncbi:MAG: hypothetical protein BGO38_12740 [Cellulomonas sp. 73-145]|uniref:FGGY-family carbohydrate kinase n=1 Tax=unclassified Cellulomonas TaxID=2620175 RepID=UPI00092B795C|nr:FGGY family carbohydrate kinase [Cellulomonas sp. 73-145]OJV59659.1 MAG: hypothetical protein BGO38_12740 [Cellulomonas sp. 73-145]
MFLGVDVGTFETKGVLVDTSGAVRAAASRRHGLATPRAGHVEHDAEAVWWADVVAVCRELVGRDLGRVDAVGVSAIGPCVLPVDRDLRPLRPAILYGVDTRAQAQVTALERRLGTEEVVRRTGNRLTSQSAGPKIAWLHDEDPDVWRSARWFHTSQSWIVARLTGRSVIDHATAGYFHPFYRLAEHRWDVSGCDDLVDVGRLPELAWSGELAGPLTADASAATGLPGGTPVIVGTTDSPAEAVGSGVLGSGELMAMYGSSSYHIRVGTDPIVDPALWAAPFVFPGTSVLAAGTSTAGTATRWAADLLGLAGDDETVFTALLALAQDAPSGSDGVMFLPHLAGERTPVQDPDSRGVLAGLGLAHGRRHVARAVLEGIAHSVVHALSAYDAAGADLSTITAVGGLTRNPVVMRAVSAMTGLDQRVAATSGASFGDAMLGALAVGALPDRDAARAWVTYREPVTAVADDRLTADHRDYVRLYEAMAPWQHRRRGA